MLSAPNNGGDDIFARFPFVAMEEAARLAGEGLKNSFSSVGRLKVYEKSRFDVYSDADVQAEDDVFSVLSRSAPSYGFLMEERGKIVGGDPNVRWTVDPLDGTKNFLHGIPLYAVSLALEKYADGLWRSVAGLTYMPAQGTLYYAEEKFGAYAIDNNAMPRRLAMRGPLHSTHRLASLGHTPAPHIAQTLRRQGFSFREMGAATLSFALLAEDKLDAVSLPNAKRWDIAAGVALVREAGGVVTCLKGNMNFDDGASVAAGNKETHAALLAAAVS
ncbi:MAG: inositol monophosphatase [Rickettsiales bacterium]